MRAGPGRAVVATEPLDEQLQRALGAVHPQVELGRVDRLVDPARGRAPERELRVVVLGGHIDAQLHEPATVPVGPRRGPGPLVRPLLVADAEGQPGRRAHDLPGVVPRAAGRASRRAARAGPCPGRGAPTRSTCTRGGPPTVWTCRSGARPAVRVRRTPDAPATGHPQAIRSLPTRRHEPTPACAAGTSTKECIHRVGQRHEADHARRARVGLVPVDRSHHRVRPVPKLSVLEGTFENMPGAVAVEELVALSPGPGLATALGALDLSRVPSAGLVDVLRAQSRQCAHEQARLWASLVEVGLAVPPDELPDGSSDAGAGSGGGGGRPAKWPRRSPGPRAAQTGSWTWRRSSCARCRRCSPRCGPGRSTVARRWCSRGPARRPRRPPARPFPRPGTGPPRPGPGSHLQPPGLSPPGAPLRPGPHARPRPRWSYRAGQPRSRLQSPPSAQARSRMAARPTHAGLCSSGRARWGRCTAPGASRSCRRCPTHAPAHPNPTTITQGRMWIEVPILRLPDPRSPSGARPPPASPDEPAPF